MYWNDCVAALPFLSSRSAKDVKQYRKEHNEENPTIPNIGTVMDALGKRPDDENTTTAEKEAVHFFCHVVLTSQETKLKNDKTMTGMSIMEILGKDWCPIMALSAILLSHASNITNIVENSRLGEGDKKKRKTVFDNRDQIQLFMDHTTYTEKFTVWYNQSKTDESVLEGFAAWDVETGMTRKRKESHAEKRARDGPPDAADRKRKLGDTTLDGSASCFRLLQIIGLPSKRKCDASEQPYKSPPHLGSEQQDGQEVSPALAVMVAQGEQLPSFGEVTQQEQV